MSHLGKNKCLKWVYIRSPLVLVYGEGYIEKRCKNAMAPMEIVYFSLTYKSPGRVVGLYDVTQRC